MSYKKPEKQEYARQPDWCQTNRCGQEADVVLITPHGQKISMCARHYTDLVDSRNLGATSKIVSERLNLEQEAMEIVGRREYIRSAISKMREMIDRMTKRKIPEARELDIPEEHKPPQDDIDWFEQHGYRPYQPGEENLT